MSGKTFKQCYEACLGDGLCASFLYGRPEVAAAT